MKAILTFLYSIPSRLGVDPMKWKWGFWSYFFAREVLHFVGGFLLGCLAALIGLIHPMALVIAFSVIAGLLIATITALEIMDQQKGQAKFKTIIDLFAWFGGMVLTIYLFA